MKTMESENLQAWDRINRTTTSIFQTSRQEIGEKVFNAWNLKKLSGAQTREVYWTIYQTIAGEYRTRARQTHLNE